MERFGKPGRTLLGSDSHTPAAGSLGMLAMGAGGLEVALAMAGEPVHLRMPSVVGVQLTGRLPDWVMDRHVIANMGTELGATTTVFPSDETVRRFLKTQGREADWVPIAAGEKAEYDETDATAASGWARLRPPARSASGPFPATSPAAPAQRRIKSIFAARRPQPLRR